MVGFASPFFYFLNKNFIKIICYVVGSLVTQHSIVKEGWYWLSELRIVVNNDWGQRMCSIFTEWDELLEELFTSYSVRTFTLTLQKYLWGSLSDISWITSIFRASFPYHCGWFCLRCTTKGLPEVVQHRHHRNWAHFAFPRMYDLSINAYVFFVDFTSRWLTVIKI